MDRGTDLTTEIVASHVEYDMAKLAELQEGVMIVEHYLDTGRAHAAHEYLKGLESKLRSFIKVQHQRHGF